MTTVPHADEIKRSRKHATLKDTQKEPRRQKAGIARNKALEHSHESKPKHANRQPNARLELLENYVRRDFEQDIGHEEDDERGVVFVAVDDAEFFGEPEDVSVRNVDAIQECCIEINISFKLD